MHWVHCDTVCGLRCVIDDLINVNYFPTMRLRWNCARLCIIITARRKLVCWLTISHGESWSQMISLQEFFDSGRWRSDRRPWLRAGQQFNSFNIKFRFNLNKCGENILKTIFVQLLEWVKRYFDDSVIVNPENFVSRFLGTTLNLWTTIRRLFCFTFTDRGLWRRALIFRL